MINKPSFYKEVTAYNGFVTLKKDRFRCDIRVSSIDHIETEKRHESVIYAQIDGELVDGDTEVTIYTKGQEFLVVTDAASASIFLEYLRDEYMRNLLVCQPLAD